jgi:hypothetical protein
LNSPRSCAIQAGENADDGCEKGISSVPLGTGLAAADAAADAAGLDSAAGIRDPEA